MSKQNKLDELNSKLRKAYIELAALDAEKRQLTEQLQLERALDLRKQEG